jgi:hypothetical protein
MAARDLDGKQEWEGSSETGGWCNGARAHRAEAQWRDVLGGRTVGDNERVRGASRNSGGRGPGHNGGSYGS